MFQAIRPPATFSPLDSVAILVATDGSRCVVCNAGWILQRAFFKFVAPLLPYIGPHSKSLLELPPAFVVSGMVAIVVSLLDEKGLEAMAGVDRELLNLDVEIPKI